MLAAFLSAYDPSDLPGGSIALFVSGLTFGGVRTNVLQGTVHILLFIVYVALIFSP